MSRIDIEWDDKVFAKHLNYIRSQLEKEISTIIEEGGQDIVNIASMTAPKQYGFLRASLGKTNPSLITGATATSRSIGKALKAGKDVTKKVGNRVVLATFGPSKVPELKGVWRLEKDADSVSLEVGSGMKYARAMEYYQAAFNVASKKRKMWRMREGRSPYLAPAFAMATPKVIKKLKALIGKVLNAKG